MRPPLAKVTAKLPDDIFDGLSKLGVHSDAVAEEMLKAGAKVVEAEVRAKLSEVIGQNTKYESRSTGQLLSALGTSGVLIDKNGSSNIKIGFAEDRKDGKSNAMLASVMEYGKSDRPAKPFLKKAKAKSRKKCEEAMKQEFERQVKAYVDT